MARKGETLDQWRARMVKTTQSVEYVWCPWCKHRARGYITMIADTRIYRGTCSHCGRDWRRRKGVPRE